MNSRNIITIILFGSIWGFAEATMGGLLHLARVPFTGTIMSSIGFSILFLATRNGAKFIHLPLISLVAASFKFLDCWLFGIPIVHITIINPATAIACQGFAAALIFGSMKTNDRIASLVPSFLAAAALSMITFNAISIGAYGWATFHTKAPLNTALVQLPAMVICATALTKGILVMSRRTQLSMSLGWKAVAVVGCLVSAVITKLII